MLRTQKIVAGLRNLLRKKNHVPFSDKNKLLHAATGGTRGERGKNQEKTLAFRCAGKLSHKQGA